MEISWKLMVCDHGNSMGVQTMEISCGQNDIKIPWKFHGNSWFAAMVIPWVCKPWKFHVGKMI